MTMQLTAAKGGVMRRLRIRRRSTTAAPALIAAAMHLSDATRACAYAAFRCTPKRRPPASRELIGSRRCPRYSTCTFRAGLPRPHLRSFSLPPRFPASTMPRLWRHPVPTPLIGSACEFSTRPAEKHDTSCRRCQTPVIEQARSDRAGARIGHNPSSNSECSLGGVGSDPKLDTRGPRQPHASAVPQESQPGARSRCPETSELVVPLQTIDPHPALVSAWMHGSHDEFQVRTSETEH